MSRASERNSNKDDHRSHKSNLTDLAFGGGSTPGEGVGMSSPLPNPLTEMGAAGTRPSSTANSNMQRVQPKSSSVRPTTKEQNTSWPPDNVQPPPHNMTEQGHGHYGAWFSTFGAQRGASLLSSGRQEAPPHNYRGASMTSSGKPEVPSRDQPDVAGMIKEARMARTKEMAVMAQRGEQAVSLVDIRENQARGRPDSGQVSVSSSQGSPGRSQREPTWVMSPQAPR